MPKLIVKANQSDGEARRVRLSEPVRATGAPDPAGDERDHELAAALWLYKWSYDALLPTGELLASRLTSSDVLRPGSKAARISSRRRQVSPLGSVHEVRS